MITEFDSEYPTETAYKEILKQSSHGNFESVSSIKNEQVVLRGKRSYSTGILIALIAVGILLFIVGLVIAAIYYWTRPYQKIIIEFEPRDTGSTITIKTEGKIDEIAIYDIKKTLGLK